MSTEIDADIGSYEREVLRLLTQLGEGQRHQADDTRALKSQVEGLTEQLLDLKRSMTGSLTGLSQRVVAVEERLGVVEPAVATLQAQGTALGARADAADQRAQALTGWPLRLVAASGIVVAAAAVAIAILLVIIIAR